MANPSFPLPDYLKAQEALFRAATRQLQSGSNPPSLSEAAEWLPDNFYLVQQTCRQIREDMPASFYRQLPKRDAGLLQGYPRVYAIAQKLIVLRQARLTGEVEARILISDHLTATLHELVEQEKTDLVLLSAHGVSGQTRGPYGDVVGNLIAYGTTPLVIMQEGLQTPTAPTPIEVANDESKGQ